MDIFPEEPTLAIWIYHKFSPWNDQDFDVTRQKQKGDRESSGESLLGQSNLEKELNKCLQVKVKSQDRVLSPGWQRVNRIGQNLGEFQN